MPFWLLTFLLRKLRIGKKSHALLVCFVCSLQITHVPVLGPYMKFLSRLSFPSAPVVFRSHLIPAFNLSILPSSCHRRCFDSFQVSSWIKQRAGVDGNHDDNDCYVDA